jgi:hypothetical protein
MTREKDLMERHKVISTLLNILASPEEGKSYTVLEWMLACQKFGGVSYDEFCEAVSLLRDAGVIRSRGVAPNISSYIFDAQTWNERELRI